MEYIFRNISLSSNWNNPVNARPDNASVFCLSIIVLLAIILIILICPWQAWHNKYRIAKEKKAYLQFLREVENILLHNNISQIEE